LSAEPHGGHFSALPEFQRSVSQRFGYFMDTSSKFHKENSSPKVTPDHLVVVPSRTLDGPMKRKPHELPTTPSCTYDPKSRDDPRKQVIEAAFVDECVCLVEQSS
jgi:hypothetical protein